MAGKGRFRIPSAKEMEKMEDRTEKMKSLFESHKSNKSSTEKTNASNTPLGSSSINKQTCNVVQQSVAGPSKQRATSALTSGTRIHVRDQQSKAVVTPGACSDIRPTEKDSTNQITQASSDNQAASSEGTPASGKPGKTNSIIVSTRQKGNPILKHVRNVPWEFGDIIPDYVLGHSTCALFLSLRYHALNPNYIHERFKQLGHSYDLRVLLTQVDTKDPQFALKALAKVCILVDCTLILAWTPEEAGRYLETYKSFEVKPPDLIMEKTDSNYMSQLTDTLTAVKKVNKTDAMTLLTAFGSLEQIVAASEEDLSLCPGFGPQKAKRLHSVFHEPFIKSKKSKPEEPPSPTKKLTASPRKKKMDVTGS